MAEPHLFVADPERSLAQLDAHGPVDLVVGIPSYREADAIGHVVRQADQGLREYFGERRALILNVDNDSPDGTRDAFEGAGSETACVYLSTPPGVTGKGNNFWNLFVAARHLEAEAVVCVDADLMSIGPGWIRDLAQPLLDDRCDYVTPQYARNEYDGTITNNICFPMLRGVLGTRLRQPIGGDFGLSRSFADHVLEQRWVQTTREFGIDIFLTCCALFGGFRVAQTHLGAKVHKHSAPKLGPMFSQVVGTFFERLVAEPQAWMKGVTKTDLPLLSEVAHSDPQGLPIDYKEIRRTTLEHYADSHTVLARHLAPKRVKTVQRMMDSQIMDLPSALWCECVYDLFHGFAVSGEEQRPQVIEALKPLFFARVASFYKETLELGHEESEARIVEQAELFHAHRAGLLERFGVRDAASPEARSEVKHRG